MQTILTMFASILWTTFVFWWGVRHLSPDDNARGRSASFGGLIWVSVWFGLLGGAAAFLRYIPFVLPLVAVVYIVSYYLVFSEYYGLGAKRMLRLVGIQIVGALLFSLGRYLLGV